jgi:hypothetical protein
MSTSGSTYAWLRSYYVPSLVNSSWLRLADAVVISGGIFDLGDVCVVFHTVLFSFPNSALLLFL